MSSPFGWWTAWKKRGEGLNLCYEVRRGILSPHGPGPGRDPGGQIVRLADKIAYINHDIDDAMRGGDHLSSDIPPWISPRCWGLTTAGGSTR